jgi:HAD superfamily hydrolase (TIGR01456 family)
MPYWKKKRKSIDSKTITSRKPEKIAAVFVASEPNSDWFSSLQVILDIVMSNGETVEEFGGVSSDSQVVELYFGNPDFSYPATHSVPRLTCGAFRTCLETLFLRSTGRHLRSVCLGKPERHVFESALRSLMSQRNNDQDFDTIYMVGDNPASDIRGANRMGSPWESVLVLTGKSSKNNLKNPARHVKNNVLEAVEMALRVHGKR